MPDTGIITTHVRGVDVVVVEWKLENFFTLSARDGAEYYSPDFSFGGVRWFLEIYPYGWSGRDSYRHVDLWLCKYDSYRSMKQSFSLSLKTVRGKKYKEQHSMKDFKKGWDYHEFNRFIRRSELSKRRSELLPDDVLTVVCTIKSSTSAGSDSTESFASAECCHCKRIFNAVDLSSHQKKCMLRLVKCPDCLEVVELQKWLDEHECQQERTEAAKDIEQNSEDASVEVVEASTQTVEEKCEACTPGSSRSTNSQEKKALHDFKELFLTKEECDITIKVKGSEFPAHRVILKTRSPVMASTFRHDMKESATGVLETDDCDPSSFSDFLCFIYCADVQMITQKNVFGLFKLADKYQVLDLRSKCLEFMKNNMTVNTFCENITLAHRHSETELIKLCTDYFKKNAPKIIVTVKWQKFLAENPTESNELLIKLLVPNSS